jgi:hypothetical protein
LRGGGCCVSGGWGWGGWGWGGCDASGPAARIWSPARRPGRSVARPATLLPAQGPAAGRRDGAAGGDIPAPRRPSGARRPPAPRRPAAPPAHRVLLARPVVDHRERPAAASGRGPHGLVAGLGGLQLHALGELLAEHRQARLRARARHGGERGLCALSGVPLCRGCLQWRGVRVLFGLFVLVWGPYEIQGVICLPRRHPWRGCKRPMEVSRDPFHAILMVLPLCASAARPSRRPPASRRPDLQHMAQGAAPHASLPPYTQPCFITAPPPRGGSAPRSARQRNSGRPSGQKGTGGRAPPLAAASAASAGSLTS